MSNFEDKKEDLLQNVEDLLKKLSGSERQYLAMEIIQSAAFWGTQSQTPIESLKESIEIIQSAATCFQCDCKVQADIEQFSLN